MPGISAVKTGIPFSKKGFNFSSYWTTLISATVENAAPTHVVLTFAAANAQITSADFTVAGFTVVSGSWAGAVFTLVLTDPVIRFHGNLTITFAKSGENAIVTNNVADDSHTVAWWDRTIAERVTKDGSNAESIYWDWNVGKVLGSELNSGNTVVYAVYQITATEANHFYDGCQVGDVFVCGTAKALDLNNKVKRYNGNPLTQPVAIRQPINGLFDGDNDFMKCVDISTLNRPATIYAVVKQKTFTNSDTLWDGSLDSTFRLLQRTTSPNIAAYNGAGTITANTNMPIDTWVIIRMSFDAEASPQSHLQVNNTAVVDSACGTAQPRGLTLGRISVSDSNYANMEFKEAILRDQIDSAEIQGNIYNYLNTKHGLLLTPI